MISYFTTLANERKVRGSNPNFPAGKTALAERPGQPYPATFRKWTATDSNRDFLLAGQVSSHWTSSPKSTMRESNPPNRFGRPVPDQSANGAFLTSRAGLPPACRGSIRN